MAIDTDWFQNRLKEKGISQRELARMMVGVRDQVLDNSSVVNMLAGKRHMYLMEAVQLAEILEVPLEEISKRVLGKKKR